MRIQPINLIFVDVCKAKGGVATLRFLQALALQEELSDAKERNLRLQARLQRKESELEEARAAAAAAEGERERLRGRIREMEEEGKAEKTDKGVAESNLDDQNQVGNWTAERRTTLISNLCRENISLGVLLG